MLKKHPFKKKEKEDKKEKKDWRKVEDRIEGLRKLASLRQV